MEYLLTDKNLKVLESFAIVKTLYAFDYDGTLAAIQSDPSKAYMTDRVSELIKNLSTVANVAIITGRSVDDVRKFLDFEPDYIIGNHGIEGLHTLEELAQMNSLNLLWKKLVSHLPPEFKLEDKKYSLSLHSQSDFSPVMAILESLPEATLIRGKAVMNIVPRIGLNKGEALNKLMEVNKFHFGFYIGDDQTDENVFAYKNSRIITVKVGPEPETLAKYFINTQSEIEILLESLIKFVS